ncbi:hypothetical protein [Taibaiella chishuiensis]|uniref:Uncharacterized protein n=1 Tax=Taibaiella chishuiensis TaxID=1434707 RepID=A0A2P8D0R5_9BACT|nr:hypothetical protein [Taibaiella chishuiensis]PSK90798.1 hypothetical protein B0I18_107210 [Taibaiella chishuiensis]
MSYPFTPDGVTLKTADLYVLDDSDLLIEAKEMVKDLYAWTALNFTLSTKQHTYFSLLPPNVLFAWGALLATAILHRSVIVMQDVPNNYGPPRRTKQVAIEFCGVTNYFPPISGIDPIGGSFTTSIKYDLVD